MVETWHHICNNVSIVSISAHVGVHEWKWRVRLKSRSYNYRTPWWTWRPRDETTWSGKPLTRCEVNTLCNVCAVEHAKPRRRRNCASYHKSSHSAPLWERLFKCLQMLAYFKLWKKTCWRKESVRMRVVKRASAFVREGQNARGEGAKWLLVGKRRQPLISLK